MVQSHFFETLLPWQAPEELKRRVPPRSISGENPLWMFLGEIVDYDVFVERIPAAGISSVYNPKILPSLTVVFDSTMNLAR